MGGEPAVGISGQLPATDDQGVEANLALANPIDGGGRYAHLRQIGQRELQHK